MTMMISTHSPYIVNYLNVLLYRSDKDININKDLLAVYRVYDGEIQDLMMRDDKGKVVAVDTRDLAETMQTIFNEYVGLKRLQQ